MVRKLVSAALGAALLAVAAPTTSAAPADALEQETKPNILIFVTDDQRLDGTMSVLPSVRKWFGDEGTEFTNAFATTPLCCPSRASILTGRYPHNHRVLQNGKDAVRDLDFSQTLPRYLTDVGYRTALFGKYFNHWPKDMAPRYFDEYAVSGAKYYDARFNINGEQEKVKEYSTDFIAEHADTFVESAATGTDPWFMYVAPVAAHAPYQPEPDYENAPIPARKPDASVSEADRSDKPPWVQRRKLAKDRNIDRKYEGQLRALMSVDDMVDEVMTTLEETGQADNTLAIFMSDNGFLWGEHGLGQKKYPYLPSIEIPLFARWPGHFGEDHKDTRLAANIDITPTVMEAAGIEPEEELDGLSLLEPLRRSALFLEYESDFKKFLPNWASVVTPLHQYIEYYSREGDHVYTEYYDLVRDPSQLHNAFGDNDPANDPPIPVRRRLEDLTDRGRSCRGTNCHFRI